MGLEDGAGRTKERSHHQPHKKDTTNDAGPQQQLQVAVMSLEDRELDFLQKVFDAGRCPKRAISVTQPGALADVFPADRPDETASVEGSDVVLAAEHGGFEKLSDRVLA